MSTDPTKSSKPLEPTQGVYYRPYNPYEHTSPYGGYIPYPPPPPFMSRHRKLKVFLIVLAALVVIFSLIAGTKLVIQSQSKSAELPAPVIVGGPTITPTQDALQALSSPDFPSFIKAFATLLAEKNYTAIAGASDTQNFQYTPLCADSGGGWSYTYDALTTGNLSLVVQYPVITPDQEEYTGYSPGGRWSMGINAKSVEYVVGTASGPDVDGTTQAYTNGSVFIFELPYPTGGPLPWLWRCLVLSNQMHC